MWPGVVNHRLTLNSCGTVWVVTKQLWHFCSRSPTSARSHQSLFVRVPFHFCIIYNELIWAQVECHHEFDFLLFDFFLVINGAENFLCFYWAFMYFPWRSVYSYCVCVCTHVCVCRSTCTCECFRVCSCVCMCINVCVFILVSLHFCDNYHDQN